MTQRTKHGTESVMLLVLALSLSACGLSGSAQTGEVLDEATEKPIEGAIVVAEWIGDVSANWADSKTTCYHVATATTDDDGEYRIPGWSMEKEDKRDWHKNLTPRDVSITVYKAGYVMAEKSFTSGSYEKGGYYLKPFTGTVGERLEYLSNSRGAECGEWEDYSKSLVPFYKALYMEALGIAQSPEELKIVKSLRYSLDIMELGYDAAQKRLTEGAYDK